MKTGTFKMDYYFYFGLVMASFRWLALTEVHSLGLSDSGEDNFRLLEDFYIKEKLHVINQGSTDFAHSDIDPKNVSAISERCRKLLNDFAQSASKFTDCIVINSRPVTICTMCVPSLLDMRISFGAIIEDATGDCQHQFLNRDRLMVVQRSFEYLNDIWSDGRCDNCFFIQHINGTDTYTLCNETKMFYKKWYDVADCLNSSYINESLYVKSTRRKNESIVCEVCQPTYLELNRYYEYLNTKYSNLQCMDVMDLMNLTRHMWTKTYHCVQFDFNGLPVFILSGVMALIPILFYGGNRIFSHVRDTRLMQQKRLSFVHSSFNSSAAIQRDYAGH